MDYLRHIAPRRIILAVLCLAGLFLRLWGLDWGDGQPGLPQEWTASIIGQLSFESPTYPGMWTQTFYSLAALIKGAADWIYAGFAMLLGQSRMAQESLTSPLLIGRFVSALMSWLSIPLAYVVGRRYFDSVGTGLLAASLLAVNPLLVAYAHYLTPDTPLSFMVLLCLLISWRMAKDPKMWVFVCCGVVLGLTITTRASGILVLPAVLWSYAEAVNRFGTEKLKRRFIWPAALIVGSLVGLMAGYPEFFLDSTHSFRVLGGSFPGLLQPEEGWLDFLGSRFGQAWDLFAPELGLEFLALWPVGVVLLIVKRRWSRIPLVILPVLFLFISLLGLKGALAGLTVVWLPAAAMVSVWPLVLLCRRLPGDFWPVAAAIVFGVMLCIWPLWRSLGAAYIFWQEDTRAAASAWILEHVPPDSTLWMDSSLAVGGVKETTVLKAGDAAFSSLAAGSYALIPRNAWAERANADQAGEWQSLAVFDLKRGLGRLDPGGEGWFPPGVSPGLEAQVKLPALNVLQPLALVRPPWDAAKTHALIYSGAANYSKGQGYMKLGANSLCERVLHLEKPERRLGLRISNLGRDLAQLKIGQGPWPSNRVKLYPGQSKDVLLTAHAWPPMVHGMHPVSLELKQGDEVMAQLAWNPLDLGRRALENNRLEEAAEILGQHIESGGQGFDAHAMLAEAHARLGQFEKAGQTLRLLDLKHPKAVETYHVLGRAPMIDEAWQRLFEQFSGYHLELLQRACRLSFEVNPPLWLTMSRSQKLKGKGYEASWVVDAENTYGLLDMKLTDPLPQGSMQVSLDLVSQNTPRKGRDLARVELWARKGGSSRLLHHSVINAGSVENRRASLSIPVSIPPPGGYLVLKLKFLVPDRMWLSNFRVQTDLRAHMRHMLRWYFDAAGRVAHKAGKFPQAVKAFESLLVLDPGFRPAYLPLTQALMDSGKLDKAYIWSRQAERLFQSQPDALSKLRDLYQQMQKKQDVARVDERLAHLRPSLKRQSEFTGGLDLMGYDLPKTKLKSGQALTVSYYWRIRFTPPLDYYIFIHLRGPGGKQYIFDHRLDGGRLPMTALEPGQVVREDFNHPIPADAPKGRYKLMVGLWDPKFTGEAMPVTAGDDKGKEEVILAEVEIQ